MTKNVAQQMVLLNGSPLDLAKVAFRAVRAKPVVIFAMQMTAPFVLATAWGEVGGKGGDYLLVDADGGLFVCDQEMFVKSYEIIGSAPKPFEEIAHASGR